MAEKNDYEFKLTKEKKGNTDVIHVKTQLNVELSFTGLWRKLLLTR